MVRALIGGILVAVGTFLVFENMSVLVEPEKVQNMIYMGYGSAVIGLGLLIWGVVADSKLEAK